MTNQTLSGRKVIELGTMIAAPFATHILSQLGAEIIKVEPLTGDTTRALVRGGPSGTFIAYNHGKKSIAIDLTSADGLAASQGKPEWNDMVLAAIYAALIAVLLVFALFGIGTIIKVLTLAFIATLGVMILSRAKLGGHTGDTLGLSQKITELSVLLALASA